MICSFVIYIIGPVAHVRIRRIERIRITPAWLEREAAEDLAALRFIASSPEISRELWIYAPKGTFRFLRLANTGLVEIGRDGNPLTCSAGAGGDQLPQPLGESPPPATRGKWVPRDLPSSEDLTLIGVGEEPDPTEAL
jgi:hypothetical protein